jgi:hypothetical protein
MTSTHKTPKKTTAVFAIIFLLLALYIFGQWINVFTRDITPAQKVVEFSEQFPAFISDYKLIIYISMACCLAAMILAAKSFKQRLLSLRIAMWLTVMVASLIFFVDLFQLF